eukprot:4197893-Amphidinium_carterae.2
MQLRWMKAHQTNQAVIDGRVLPEDFQGNQDADAVAIFAAEHDPHEPSKDWLHWEAIFKMHGASFLGQFTSLPETISEPPPVLPGGGSPQTTFEVGPHTIKLLSSLSLPRVKNPQARVIQEVVLQKVILYLKECLIIR